MNTSTFTGHDFGPWVSVLIDNAPHDNYSAVMLTLQGRTVDLPLPEARALLDELNAAVEWMQAHSPIPYQLTAL
ncbi:hypothetical protein QP028_11115 [Corynebacterium suedekumii]|nr:hypothetical protein QP028_11115 [Corynebacterium suedekumii]